MFVHVVSLKLVLYIINVGEMCFISPYSGICQLRWQQLSPGCSFNIFYIYQAFIFFFHKALHPPSLFLSLSVHLSLSVVPHLVFPISGLSLRFGDVDVFFLQSKVAPSCDHCRTETVLPASDHYCIDTVAPSGDHY